VNDLVAQARRFARLAHCNQRYGDRPYTDHLAHAVMVAEEFELADILQAAVWLHDVLEDTDSQEGTLRFWFGPEVARLVVAVTKPAGSRSDYWEKIRKAGSWAVAVKLCDRIANVEAALESPEKMDNRFFRMYAAEYPAFRLALQKKGNNPKMWERLDRLMAGRIE